MRQNPVIVIHLESISYTGTTWLNLILGSHERAFAIGPADRALGLEKGGGACLLHGADCPFWSSFYESFDPEENFFLQLADHSGKDVLVTNNLIPEGAGKHLKHPDILVRRIRVVRDARAVLASWMRTFPDKTLEDAIELSVAPAYQSQAYLIDPRNPRFLFCRYEDVLAGKESWLERFARFTGVDYTPASLRFWEFEHHPVSGNKGTISLLKFAEGIRIPEGYRDKEFYEEQYRRSVENQGFDGNRWERELRQEDRFLVDLCVGSYQEALGYQRDRFDLEFVRWQVERLDALPQKRPYVSEALKSLRRGLAGTVESEDGILLPVGQQAKFIKRFRGPSFWQWALLVRSICPDRVLRRVLRLLPTGLRRRILARLHGG